MKVICSMTQLLTTMELWSEVLDSGAPFDAIYLDFRKAFDTVRHQRLLKKLEAFGIKGNILSWISNFLCWCTRFLTASIG